MSGWPSLDRVDDERLARSLGTDDTGALLQLMDRYAARLYDYCHALLRDEDAAAGALHDALIAAYAHVGLLREPARFRSWLYALVRNECLRRLHDPDRPAERREAPEVEDVFLDPAERDRRLETRQLVHGALSGLRGREREALDLLLRHGLDAAEVGGVLAMDAQGATGLAGEARHRLDDALAAAFIARTGRDDCPEVAGLAGDGGVPLTPPVARRLARHIESCTVCTERRDRTVSTARLLQVLPVALVPTDLRGRVMVTVTDRTPDGAFTMIADRAGPFDTWGWPAPPAPAEHAAHRRTPPRLWPALAAAAVVMLIVAAGVMIIPGPSKSPSSAQGPGTSAAPDPSEPESGSPEPSESAEPTPTVTTTTPTATPSPTTTPTMSRRTPTPSPGRTSPTSRAPAPAPGSLSVGSCSIPAGSSSCALSVRAVGGPVTWSVTGAGGGLGASGGGRLGRGASASVTVTRTTACTADGSGTVSFSPNGTAPVSWKCEQDEPGPGEGGDGG